MSGADIAVTNGVGTYRITFNGNTLAYTVVKIANPANQLPTANAGVDFTVAAGVAAKFDGSLSADADGTIANYTWSNGLTGAKPSLIYNTAGTYTVTLTVTDNDGGTATDSVTVTVTPASTAKRTVILIYGQTTTGQDMFIRGGIDSTWSNTNRGTSCSGTVGGLHNLGCSIGITHLNTLHQKTNPWRVGDLNLDWGKLTTAMDGRESGQGTGAAGSPAVWTTNDPAYANKVDVYGSGYTPLNTYGQHYWMLDVTMECSKSVNGWFEFKTYISNGPGWESNVAQTQFGGLTPPPYTSGNHFGYCGKVNVFQRNVANPVTIKDF